MRKSSPCSTSKQGPMRATLPVSSLLRQGRQGSSLRKSNSNSPTVSPTNASAWRARISPETSSSGQRSPGSLSYKGIYTHCSTSSRTYYTLLSFATLCCVCHFMFSVPSYTTVYLSLPPSLPSRLNRVLFMYFLFLPFPLFSFRRCNTTNYKCLLCRYIVHRFSIDRLFASVSLFLVVPFATVLDVLFFTRFGIIRLYQLRICHTYSRL